MNSRIIITIIFLWTMVNTMMAEDKIYGNPFSIGVGKTAEVEVLLDNSAPYVGFQFDLTLPYGVIVTGYEVNRSRIPASTEVSMAQQEDGSYRFFATALSLDPIVGNSGKMITLRLKATNMAFAGNQPVGIKNMKLSKADATGLTLSDWTSFTTAKVFLPSDTNGDGKVTITDAVAIVSHIIGDEIDGFIPEAADVNGDSNITITDAVAIVDMILNGSASAKTRSDMDEDMHEPQ